MSKGISSMNKITVRDVADLLMNPPGDVEESLELTRYIEAGKRAASAMGVTPLIDATSGRAEALSIRNIVFDRVSAIGSVVVRAKDAGFVSPENPFVFISSLNIGREMFGELSIDEDLAGRLVVTMRDLGALVNAELAGEISFVEDDASRAQLSSFTVSLGGAASLSELIPEPFKVLKSLDFVNRTPRILFTADYKPADRRLGAVVGWMRMPDASGYVVRRHDVFNDVDNALAVTNQQARDEYDRIREYVVKWVLSFYSSIDPDDIFAIVDTTPKRDSYHLYTVTAFQDASIGRVLPFDVDVSVVSFSADQMFALRSELVAGRRSAVGTDINPYPSISRKLYGTDEYDWVIAAMNVKASIARLDDISRVKKFSYFGSTLQFLEQELTAGNVVAPVDVSKVISNIDDSIMSFGVSQTIMEIFDRSGILLFFTDQDAAADSIERDSGMVASVLSSIDPETATVDPKILATNVFGGIDLSSVMGRRSRSTAAVEEIDVVPRSTASDDVTSDDLAYAIDDSISADLIDLTTAVGIGRLVRMLRTFFESTRANAR